MKKILLSFILMAVIIMMGGCAGSKKVAYFQNIDTLSLAASRGLYDAHIMPKDMLTITVITTNPAASAPFNLTVSNTVGTSGQLSTAGVGSLQGYLVDNDGNINFPVIGTLHVGGLTKTACEELVKSKVKPYLAEKENPIVTVRMASYRVTVTGEVASPGVKPVTTEKMSIIEAIAQAGDLTIYGRRDNVLLIREDANGEKQAHRLNLNDANIINSPYYYLQQNDIIYVEPNGAKKGTAGLSNSITFWIGLVSSIISLATLAVSVAK